MVENRYEHDGNGARGIVIASLFCAVVYVFLAWLLLSSK